MQCLDVIFVDAFRTANERVETLPKSCASFSSVSHEGLV